MIHRQYPRRGRTSLTGRACRLRLSHDAITTSDEWVLPWAILPEIDYLLARHVSVRAQEAFAADLAGGAFAVEWGRDEDLESAGQLLRRYRTLQLGLVDAVVMGMAGRLRARAIVTFDLRHFGTVALPGAPNLLPRDSIPPRRRK